MISRKAIVDKAGNVLNVIVYDDDADWHPPTGTTIVDATENAEPGATYDAKAKSFTKAAPSPVSETKTLEERMAELEKKLEAAR